MIEALGTILAGICAIVAVGVLIVAYVAWRSRKRIEDHAAEMAQEAEQAKQGGGGGPKPVR